MSEVNFSFRMSIRFSGKVSGLPHSEFSSTLIWMFIDEFPV